LTLKFAISEHHGYISLIVNLTIASNMPSFLDTHNLSILAIPAYYVLSVLPHSYALNVATGGQLTKWDNRNPRSSTLKSKLKDRLSAEEFAKYERLEACHANGMEVRFSCTIFANQTQAYYVQNMPLFAAAIVLGNMAGLKKQGLDGLNGFAGLFLAVRLLYTGVYATHQTQGPTAARSVLWFTGVALCFRTIIRAARALGGDRI
jgi:uncharacterized MAPEG superfamily protein